ncbi:MAG: exo-alpha-sialidase [Planctomycetaceae bacterium]
MKEKLGFLTPIVIVNLLCGFVSLQVALAQQYTRNSGFESFEDYNAGEFGKLQTRLGEWTSESGSTVVKAGYYKTGKQSLQLTGGEKTSVILDVGVTVDERTQLSFWAERWTVRKPFSFRIEKNSGNGWKEIYNGDAKIRVGRSFLNYVKLTLADSDLKQLRFTCTSPVDTGVMLDDIRIAPAKPQIIKSVKVVPFSLPALVGAESCALLKLQINTEGSVKPISLNSIQARTTGGDGIDALYAVSDSSEIFEIAMPASLKKDSIWEFNPIEMQEGENILWIRGQLATDSNIDGEVGVDCKAVNFSNGNSIKLDVPVSMQRMGVAVRQARDDGAHTYRIPGLATSKKGTLIGVYDVRWRGGGDLPGDIDVGMSRSTDGGRTWDPMKIIMDMGNDPKWRYDGIGDPAVLVDENTGTIWVAATWSHGNRSWRGSGPGLTPNETGQLMLVRSDDDGETWSKPINITEQVKKPEWCFILQGPGKGITMRDGTIVFAAQYQDPPEKNRLPHSTIIYSKDHGKTWHTGTGAFDDTTESQVVEIEPGVLMLNCRYNRKSARVVMTTKDLGDTWTKHATSERALIEPRACMASLIHVDQELKSLTKNTSHLENKSWLLFSNPDSLNGRNHITIKASPDNGETWPKQFRLLLDEHGSAGYSCMSMIDEDTVGILYEGSQSHMTFQRIPLSDILGDGLGQQPPQRESRQSEFSMPIVFSDQMVLQANARLPVWGTASPGRKVSVRLDSETREAFTDNQGHWFVEFDAREYSADPINLVVQAGTESRVFKDILIGEVWICAGQSNMEWMVQQSAHGSHEEQLAEYPQIRLLDLRGGARGVYGNYSQANLDSLTAQTYCRGSWVSASADSIKSFSAVGWYFGRYLQQHLDVPVGLICPAVGGSPTEAWISREALTRHSELKGLVQANWLDNELLGEFCRLRGEQNLLVPMQAGEQIPGDQLGPNHPFKPGFMWEAGIKPLIPYAMKGVIWYQGESNAEREMRVSQHEQLFVLLVESWRAQWQQGDFPFVYVQLPAINRPFWPQFRDSQRRMLDEIPNSGMAITIDTGHVTNVHPALKKPIGERLARWSLSTTYGQKQFSNCSGPLLRTVSQQQEKLVLTFSHCGEGLKSIDGQPLRHFEVCGADGVFHAATAAVIARDAIAVTSELVTRPQHARYAWIPFPNPTVNLVNSVDLPASPFTTE